jgi:trafficking protein particle complex subunit 10
MRNHTTVSTWSSPSPRLQSQVCLEYLERIHIAYVDLTYHTVQYSDPHDVYKLLAPGLVPRLPLRHLHWPSHAGPLRSIETLHVDIVPSTADGATAASPVATTGAPKPFELTPRDDGFQTAAVSGRGNSTDITDAFSLAIARPAERKRRHQIPGLRRTPYLKVLFVRCDDSDSYKAQVRSEVREWIKQNTVTVQSTKKLNTAENHDAFEWMIVHVVIPNTTAATQPRTSKTTDGSTPDGGAKSTSRWGKNSSTLLEKFRADFNGSSKSAVDRIAQIRIGINDVPYDVLPRVVPAVPSGYVETDRDIEEAWQDLVDKMKALILSSFDMRVMQYEEDIKDRDSQRSLPGWNFCTFFILKEGLARGFESVGLVEDALVGYDELSVGLDTVITEQVVAGSADTHGGTLLNFTAELKELTERALATVPQTNVDLQDETINLQSNNQGGPDSFEDILISPTRKPYRELILANNVSVFDFRCYIFSRQVALLLRMGNAWSTREELLAKLKEQQESVMQGVGVGVAPRAPPPPRAADETENLAMLAEICRRTLEFIPAVSQVMRKDILAAFSVNQGPKEENDDAKDGSKVDAVLSDIIDNVVASHAFTIAQQILAQTSTKALPIPPSTLTIPDGHEQKTSIPEPKTMMHPARSSSLHVRQGSRPPPSPNFFPGPGREAHSSDAEALHTQFLKAGLEELAARRAELYTLSRNILEERGKRRGWSNGWSSLPTVGESGIEDMEEVDLDDNHDESSDIPPTPRSPQQIVAGFDNQLLRTALDSKDDFYRLYETLTDKALRHYTVASHIHSVQANLADLGVLKYHLHDYKSAAPYFHQTTPFFGESGWSLLELSLLLTYSECLDELQRREEYAKVVLKLLSKAAAAERDRLQHQVSFRVSAKSKESSEHTEFPERTILKGYLGKMLAASKQLSMELRVPVTSLLDDLLIVGSAEYKEKEDSFSIVLQVRSLLTDPLPIDIARVRMSALGTSQPREIWLESKDSLELEPGRGTIRLYSSVSSTSHPRVSPLSYISRPLYRESMRSTRCG